AGVLGQGGEGRDGVGFLHISRVIELLWRCQGRRVDEPRCGGTPASYRGDVTELSPPHIEIASESVFSIRLSGFLPRMARNARGGAAGPFGSEFRTAQMVPRLNFSGQRIRCLPIPPLMDGKLPPGEHPVAWPDLVARFGQGSIKRRLAAQGLHRFALMLRAAGGKWLFVDGSFATARERPGDWDGCFLVGEVGWRTMDPRLRDIQANRASLKADYRCDVFAAESINREIGKPFRDFFQQDRTGSPKGILVLDLETVT
ncbi:MAG: hypothetical protein K2X74_09475, partial [Acetobacteraceae bacterium]|nr:hypothetical protein [Acetobacteraceae bacterium]